jgi:RES domain-containing protein
VFIYRIEKEKYKDIFPSRGSLYAEGRWNRRGMWVLYTSESVSLAKLEALANSGSKLPERRYLVTIKLEKQAPVIKVSVKDLPDDWHSVPYKKNLAGYIQLILEAKSYVAALVPSVQSPQEQNILLFPDHPEFDKYVQLVGYEPMGFDNRLKKF